MHIAHIQGIFSPEHGGPTQSLTNYCLGQARAGHRVSLWALEGFAHTSPAVRLPAPVESHIFATEWPSVLGRSRAMRAALRAAPKPDVFHLHGAWLRAMHYGAERARRDRIPYLLEVMGMYEPYSLRQKWPRKRFARWWFQDAILRHANCLHVNSPSEAEALRKLGFAAPIAVIPVGTPIPSRDVPESAPGLETLKGRPFVLFLSRIHAKKGVELLLRAWAALRKSEFAHRTSADRALVIAGTGDPKYVAACRTLAEELGIAGSCVWPGRVTDAQKHWLLARAQVFVLPTFSENYGNVVAEALAHGSPVITTTGTPWRELPARGCGWVVEPEAAALRAALHEALGRPPDELHAMGAAGRRWAEAALSVGRVLADLEQVYRWLLGGGPRPGSVELKR